jgi:hypothetical protein
MAFSLGNTAENVIGKVLTLIVVFAILGGVVVSFFANVKTLVTAFNNTSATGNTTVDGFLAVFGLIVAIIGVFALIKLVQNAADQA